MSFAIDHLNNRVAFLQQQEREVHTDLRILNERLDKIKQEKEVLIAAMELLRSGENQN